MKVILRLSNVTLPNYKIYIDQRPPAFPTDAITTYGTILDRRNASFFCNRLCNFLLSHP